MQRIANVCLFQTCVGSWQGHASVSHSHISCYCLLVHSTMCAGTELLHDRGHSASLPIPRNEPLAKWSSHTHTKVSNTNRHFLSTLCQCAATPFHLRLYNALSCVSGLPICSNGAPNSLLSNCVSAFHKVIQWIGQKFLQMGKFPCCTQMHKA